MAWVFLHTWHVYLWSQPKCPFNNDCSLMFWQLEKEVHTHCDALFQTLIQIQRRQHLVDEYEQKHGLPPLLRGYRNWLRPASFLYPLNCDVSKASRFLMSNLSCTWDLVYCHHVNVLLIIAYVIRLPFWINFVTAIMFSLVTAKIDILSSMLSLSDDFLNLNLGNYQKQLALYFRLRTKNKQCSWIPYCYISLGQKDSINQSINISTNSTSTTNNRFLWLIDYLYSIVLILRSIDCFDFSINREPSYF